MARFLGKTAENKEIFAYDMKDVDVKAVGENEIEMIGSTEHVDRDGEVLKLDGWDLKNYKKNPVVLPSHMYWEPAIGRAKVKIEDKSLVFRIEFPESGINPVADVYKGLYKGGFMKASSVGFIGQEWAWAEKESDPRRTFTKQELLEISLVSIPSNPTAILTEKGIDQAVRAGKLMANDIKVLEGMIKRAFEIDPDRKKIFSIPSAEGKEHAETVQKQSDIIDEKQQDSITEDDVRKIVAEEIEKAFVKKGHYINAIIDDRGSDDPTESRMSGEDVAKAVSDVFKNVGLNKK